MLELSILGFLYDEPLHGYELKERIMELTGHVKRVSDGALYPAINRLQAAGLLERRIEPGTSAAPRQMLFLTDAGRTRLLERLGNPVPTEITDRNRYWTVLAFLRHLPDREKQIDVLRRRLAFLEGPVTFFSRDGRQLRQKDMDDPFRSGMFEVARATRQAEVAWLTRAIDELASDELTSDEHTSDGHTSDGPAQGRLASGALTSPAAETRGEH
ncbi:PadR family transcriptional regulator [Actinoplanes sp. NBRC 101535]|nr:MULTISPECIES: PadR family transcriptional regulator [Actinoplanes]GLY01506.1 PadR family transcriptional regulator [Actinoplanes sp. NBRC 101535]